MKKDSIRFGAVIGILFVAYTLVAMFIPFVKNGVFWTAYFFALAALVVAGISIYIGLMKSPDVKSKFYGFPIARLGVVYLAVQAVLSLVFMGRSQWTPIRLVVLVSALLLAAALVGLISAEAVVEEIKVQDVKLKKDTALMQALRSQISPLAAQCADAGAAKELQALAEEFRYSDPVSSEALADIEAELSSCVSELQKAVVEGETAVILKLARQTRNVLTERNRLCKLGKGN